MKNRHVFWIVVLIVGALGAFVWLGPTTALSLAARALVASIVYRLVRRVIR